ncbi:hypothetical protein J4Q44_G00255280 [Coregonus suidteri]|uniref:Uncharacterized protein n=1 Tax=Coregonus suidteri TaxID=861788 RepID=A0AAN8L768_9TELE
MEGQRVTPGVVYLFSPPFLLSCLLPLQTDTHHCHRHSRYTLPWLRSLVSSKPLKNSKPCFLFFGIGPCCFVSALVNGRTLLFGQTKCECFT